jgi:hypothetical protein
MTDSPTFGRYPVAEVVSAFRKEIKLGDIENALFWLHVILTFAGKGGPRLAAKQLWIQAAEDIDDPVVVLRAAAVYQMAGTVSETDHLFFLVAHMCRARKWWQHHEGRQVDELWSKAVGDLKRDPKPIPSYALDRHTRRGWDIFQQTHEWDDRFSGTDVGRMKTLYLYKRDGRLDRDAELDPGFEEFWQARLDLDAMSLPDPEPTTQPEQADLFDGDER